MHLSGIPQRVEEQLKSKVNHFHINSTERKEAEPVPDSITQSCLDGCDSIWADGLSVIFTVRNNITCLGRRSEELWLKKEILCNCHFTYLFMGPTFCLLAHCFQIILDK